MKEKTFDCVKMKHDIQKKIAEEMKGLSEEEQSAKTEQMILANPILARIWKNARRVHISKF